MFNLTQKFSSFENFLFPKSMPLVVQSLRQKKTLAENTQIRKEFVSSLLKDNHLTVKMYNGDFYQVEVISYDKKSHQLIISDRAEDGILCLAKGEQVEFYSALNHFHEYFTFKAKVNKIKESGQRLYYGFKVPQTLQKSHRRLVQRKAINHYSFIKINDLNMNGCVLDISDNGIAVSMKGYYPFELESGSIIRGCRIDIFQPQKSLHLVIDCDLKIRRFDYLKTPEASTFLAGIMQLDNPQQQKDLNKFVLSE